MTPQRRAVLDVLTRSTDHPTAGQVFERVKRELPDVGAATVYRTLAAFVENGSAAELHAGDGRAVRYDRTVARHDHLICTDCGAVTDVEVDVTPSGSGLLERVATTHDFSAESYAITVVGRCARCRPKINQSQLTEE